MSFFEQPDPNDKPFTRTDYVAILIITACLVFMTFLFIFPEDRITDNFENYDPNEAGTIQGINSGSCWPESVCADLIEVQK